MERLQAVHVLGGPDDPPGGGRAEALEPRQCVQPSRRRGRRTAQYRFGTGLPRPSHRVPAIPRVPRGSGNAGFRGLRSGRLWCSPVSPTGDRNRQDIPRKNHERRTRTDSGSDGGASSLRLLAGARGEAAHPRQSCRGGSLRRDRPAVGKGGRHRRALSSIGKLERLSPDSDRGWAINQSLIRPEKELLQTKDTDPEARRPCDMLIRIDRNRCLAQVVIPGGAPDAPDPARTANSAKCTQKHRR